MLAKHRGRCNMGLAMAGDHEHVIAGTGRRQNGENLRFALNQNTIGASNAGGSAIMPAERLSPGVCKTVQK